LTEKDTIESRENDDNSKALIPVVAAPIGEGKKKRKKRGMNVRERAILSLVKKYPHVSIKEIGRKLVELGMYAKPEAVYAPLSKSSLLRDSVERVRQDHSEFVTRRIAPQALKRHEELLKDATLTPEQAMRAIELAEKLEFKTDERVYPMLINIEKIQAVITQHLGEESVISVGADTNIIDMEGGGNNEKEQESE